MGYKEAVEGIVAIVFVFGTISYAIKRVFDAGERKALAKKGGDPKETKLLKEQNKMLSERVENLEVADIDFQVQSDPILEDIDLGDVLGIFGAGIADIVG